MCGCVRPFTLPRFIWILQRSNRARFTHHRAGPRSVNGKEWRLTGMSALLTAAAVVSELAGAVPIQRIHSRFWLDGSASTPKGLTLACSRASWCQLSLVSSTGDGSPLGSEGRLREIPATQNWFEQKIEGLDIRPAVCLSDHDVVDAVFRRKVQPEISSQTSADGTVLPKTRAWRGLCPLF